MTISWKAEVVADNSGKWHSNGLTFPTSEEATLYARDLSMRWVLVRDYRVVPVNDSPSHTFSIARGLEPLEEKT